MKQFPCEFEALLSSDGLSILHGARPALRSTFATKQTPILILPNVISPRKAAACRRLLDESLSGCLQQVKEIIPPELIVNAKPDENESLPKTMQFRTSYLENRKSRAYLAAKRIGLIALMQSQSLREFAESATGYKLRSHRGTQIISYENGHSVGPHTDSHPEIPEARGGYVDVHLMFTDPGVDHQYLVYEENGLFRRVQNVALDGAVAIYRLPFWHYTTPLSCHLTREHVSKRWLLLAGFWILGASGMCRPEAHFKSRNNGHRRAHATI